MTIMKQQTFTDQQIEEMIAREYAVLASPFSSPVQVTVAGERMAQLVAMRSPQRLRQWKWLWACGVQHDNQKISTTIRGSTENRIN